LHKNSKSLYDYAQAHSFELETALEEGADSDYKQGGLVTQVKEAKQLNFRPLSEV
jgi:hypothetical protein